MKELAKAEVIGVILSGYTEGENIGFAVPINIFKSMPKDLSYSLDDLYNNVTYIEKPTNVTLRFSCICNIKRRLFFKKTFRNRSVI
ncbi:MAG: hypothetical protein PHN25_00925 [Tissierellia bacterium]|jgi:hypothetical protein|nr:hypothetical protein [Patescibacteria group bacterium]MDD4677749.1 hypothetical protein [Tissierellia bacterium]